MHILRGTKDILPQEIINWQYIYQTVYETLKTYNYQEIRTPIIEATDLFQRSIGNDTDIVYKEMYSFKDQGNRQITLRPEGTASIARAFIDNQLYLKKNINKLWYVGPMFRYERPQSGRQRQFHQIGIECIGSINPIADAEVIRLANQILQKLQCNDYNIELNSLGNLEERSNYTNHLIEYLSKYQTDLDQDSQRRLISNPLRILDSKDNKTQEILDNGPKLKKFLNKASLEHFDQLCQFLNILNINYTINEKLVRGLDYYNNTAFEITTYIDNNKETICGGGRYDTLIKQLGGPDTPSIGWAMGIERLLRLTNQSLNKQYHKIDLYIAIIGYGAQIEIWDIIKFIEQYDIIFELDLSNNSLKKQIKNADKVGAKFCLILGENEIKNKHLSLKNLETGQQITIANNELIYLIRMITKN
uniref:histidine--tRNA ligase n=1 Tax=Crouania attenuata TaxID=42002 RepID=A0A4D6WRP0_9FLOR|nr:Histidine-tRNA ligase [Crouania attenuata]